MVVSGKVCDEALLFQAAGGGVPPASDVAAMADGAFSASRWLQFFGGLLQIGRQVVAAGSTLMATGAGCYVSGVIRGAFCRSSGALFQWMCLRFPFLVQVAWVLFAEAATGCAHSRGRW